MDTANRIITMRGKIMNGFHIGLKFKNDHTDLYTVEWLKNGYAIATVSIDNGITVRRERVSRLSEKFLDRLETLARARKE